MDVTMYKIQLIILVSLLSVQKTSLSASFDCMKAQSYAETMICQDTVLSSLDDDLAKEYKALLKRANTNDKQAIRFMQRDWLKTWRSYCKTIKCLKLKYNSRIDFLKRWDKFYSDIKFMRVVGKHIYPVEVLNDTNSRKFKIDIKNCTLLIVVPVPNRNANRSYGAICTKTSDSPHKQVMVCDDEMVGHYSVKNINARVPSKYDLTDFVVNNCYGG